MKLISLNVIIVIFLGACAVGPYHDQIYEEVKESRSFTGENEFAIYIVDGSRNEGEEIRPPYKIGIWLLSNNAPFKKITIDEIRVSLNGENIEDVTFKHIRSDSKVNIPGPVAPINPAPCCGFMIISKELPIEHMAGDQLDIFISVTTDSLNKSSGYVTYKATIKKGFIKSVTFV
ncbi:MAG: hypothetical protein GKR93_01745 [Gammaproteobacteria bacterium]|nr:hypothetical protein [Gammaproteobacteria bacterium]